MADNQITPFQLTDQFTMDNFNQRINETNTSLQKKADTSVIDQIENDVNVLESRMNEFTSLPQGSTSGDAELTDIRVGQDGTVYGTAGNAVRAQVNQLKQDLVEEINLDNISFTLGSLTVDGDVIIPSTNRCVTDEYIKVMSGSTISVKNGYKFNVAEYNESKVKTEYRTMSSEPYTVINNGYVKFAIAKNDDSILTDTGIVENFILNLRAINVVHKTNGIYDEIHKFNIIDTDNFRVAGLTSNGEVEGSTNRITNYYQYFIKENSVISVSDNYKYSLAIYSNNDQSFESYKKFTTCDYTIPKDCYVRICIAKTDNSNFNDSDIANTVNKISINGSLGISYELQGGTKRIINSFQFVLGNLNIENGVSTTSNLRLLQENFLRVRSGDVIGITDYTNYKINLAVYSDCNEDAFVYGLSFNEFTQNYVIPKDYDGCYIRFSVAHKNDSVISNTDKKTIPEMIVFKNTLCVDDALFILKDRINADRNIISVLDKKLDFRPINYFGFYNGLQSNYELFNNSTTSTEYYQSWMNLKEAYPNYITSRHEGNAISGESIYSFTLSPLIESNKSNMPKIIIVAGQHGFEKNSPFGLYYFVKDLCEKWEESSILDYIRHHIKLVILPLMNPYGFDNNIYKNANNVNVNRNYDANFVVVQDTSSDSYGGQSAFSERESVIVKNVVEKNLDAFYFVDCHTGGSTKLTQETNYDLNAHIFNQSLCEDSYGGNILIASSDHIENITAHFVKDYEIDTSKLVGSVLKGVIEPKAKDWVYSKGIMASTLEGFSGFYGDAINNSSRSQKCMSEMIGNWLASIIRVFGNIR